MNESLRTHLSLARASNLATTWSNVVCALLLVGGFQWTVCLGAIVAVSLLYVGGMYLNDWRDADFDQKHRPERPIPSKAIPRKVVLICATTFFLLALVISVVIQLESIFWALGLLGCIIVYDLDHKNNRMSPWVMAGCRALIYPWAASLTGYEMTTELWIVLAAAYIYTLGLTYMSRGANVTPLMKVILCACVFSPVVLFATRLDPQNNLAAPAAFIVLMTWTGISISGWLGRPPRIGFTIKNLIAGFFFIDLLAICVAGQISVAILLVFSLLFIATVKIQTIISGT